MWQRFTERARRVIFYSQEEAQKFGEGYVSTEHLLLGLVRETDNLAARVLERLGANLNRVRAEVEKQLPRGDARPSQDMTLTPRAKRVIDLAYDEARNLNNNYIGSEHLLLGLVREADGLAGRVLAKLGIELEKSRRVVMEIQDSESRQGGGTPVAREPRPKSRALSYEPYGFLLGQCIVEHLFLAATGSEESPSGQAVRKLVPEFAPVQAGVWELIRRRIGKGLRPVEPAELETLLAEAHEEAVTMGAPRVEAHHLVFAALRIPSELATVLAQAGLDYWKLRAILEELIAATESGGA